MNQISDHPTGNAHPCSPLLHSSISAPIAVIGLGYVGLPLALALSRNHDVVGLDIDARRIEELKANHDRTGEADVQVLRGTDMTLTSNVAEISNAGIFIITVPTPVDDANKPDLSLVQKASETVGSVLKLGDIVIYESTVYPGVTEDICGPILERASGLICGDEFFLGYSPERINPGDTTHTLEKITKIIAAQTPSVLEVLAQLYGSITTGGVFRAADIRTAEAAKVIENAQRDINIAFVNEVAAIFNRLGIRTHDVLDAARTKWNFLDFRPGLVGGHCIGVDPFYLAHVAEQVGHTPEVILSGRRINDRMPRLIAERIDEALCRNMRVKGPARILVLGITFKENVPDIRNSKAAELVAALEAQGHDVHVHDPLADSDDVEKEYGFQITDDLETTTGEFDAIVAAVPHRAYGSIGSKTLTRLLKPHGTVADIKGIWRLQTLPEGIHRWEL